MSLDKLVLLCVCFWTWVNSLYIGSLVIVGTALIVVI